MPADTTCSTSSSEEDDCIAHELDIVFQRVQLILCKLGVGRVKLETVMNIKATVSSVEAEEERSRTA